MLQHLNIEKYRNNHNNQIIKIITGQTSSVFKYSSIETFLHINVPNLKIGKYRSNQNNHWPNISFKYSNIETFLHTNAPTLKH